MRWTRIGGFLLLATLWIWLSQGLLRSGGINLKNLLIVAMSGIIILVPLYRRYIDPVTRKESGEERKTGAGRNRKRKRR